MASTLSRGTLFVFALPAAVQGFFHAPALSIVQGIYAKETGLTLASLGAGMLVARIFDALTDPLIGVLSDAWYRRTGTRKPFVLAGAVITALGLWFVYRPPADVSIVWFVGWFLVADIGWTMTEIPYRAWSFELSGEPASRNRIQAWLAGASLVGALAFFLVPAIGKGLGLTGSAELDLQSLALAAVAIAVLTPALSLLAVAWVPDGTRSRDEGERVSLRQAWVAVRANGPLLLFIVAFMLLMFFSALGQGVSFLYATSYLGLGERYPLLAAGLMPAMLAGVPFWAWLCNRYERHKVWAASSVALALSQAASGFAAPGDFALLATCSVVATFAFAAMFICAPAILGDIADYGRWKFGCDYSATYTAVFSLAQKIVGGVGASAGLLLLAVFGFEAASREQSELATLGMKLVVAWLPATGIVLMIPFLWRFPLSRAQHAQILAMVAARGAEAHTNRHPENAA